MAEVVERVEARLDRIEATLATLQRRIAVLETSREPAPSPIAVMAPRPGDAGPALRPPAAQPGFESGTVLPLVGRTCIVFGGAFLLRALTDGGQVPRPTGIVLGLAFSLVWILGAERAAAHGRRLSALFHGLAGVAIGLPLIWEASTRFALFTPAASIAVAGAFVGVAMAVAWWRRIHSLAGMATVGGLVTIYGLAIALGAIGPATFVLILLGFATLWLGYDCDWHWMRWPAAIGADLAVLEITTRALRPEVHAAPGMVIALQVLLLGGYLAMFASRTMVKGRLVIPFEVVQTIGVLFVGLGGAVTVAQRVGTGAVALGIAGTLLGAGGYGAAFAFVGRRQGLGENFYFYATLALVLTLTGLAVVLAPVPLVAALSGLAVLTAWWAARFSRLALVLHGAVYATVAAGASGLLSDVVAAFVGTPAGAWPVPGPMAWLALAAAGACLVVPRPAGDGTAGLVTRGPRILLALVFAAGVGSVVVLLAGPLVAGTPPAAGVLATLRTAVLAFAAILLAAATRYERVAEFGYLLYPVLVIGGLKLLVDDFRYSEAGTLFVALALFGIALVAAPRLARRMT